MVGGLCCGSLKATLPEAAGQAGFTRLISPAVWWGSQSEASTYWPGRLDTRAMPMTDYHVHSDYSQDAEGSIFDYCRRARELGLEEICLTPHFEIDPVRASSMTACG